MTHQKGDSHHGLSPGCDHKGWTWPSPSSGQCRDIPEPCQQPGSLSHDTEGSCQSPAPQSCKPRRRVEVSPVPPVCPPPVKIHRRPLEQHRPRPPCPEPDSQGKKPRRRVEQIPENDEEPPVVLQPRPLQHRCARAVPCCPRPVPCCPRPVPCCPRPVPCCPRPAQPGHQQHKQVTLVPLCVKN